MKSSATLFHMIGHLGAQSDRLQDVAPILLTHLAPNTARLSVEPQAVAHRAVTRIQAQVAESDPAHPDPENLR